MDNRCKHRLEALLFTAFLWSPPASQACSLVSCLNRGKEVSRDFTVVVKLEKHPLAGVSVEIRTPAKDQPYFTGLTDATGKARIRGLPTGDYWISATYMGISAGYHCFHVLSNSSLRAKGHLNYKWGDYGMSMRLVSGNVREWQPGTGGTVLWNLSHGRTVPLPGAAVELRNARTQESFRSKSDSEGGFILPTVPDGVYVLHVEGSSTGAEYDPTNLVIFINHTATRQNLTLTRQENGCGGVWLRPDWK